MKRIVICNRKCFMFLSFALKLNSEKFENCANTITTWYLVPYHIWIYICVCVCVYHFNIHSMQIKTFQFNSYFILMWMGIFIWHLTLQQFAFESSMTELSSSQTRRQIQYEIAIFLQFFHFLFYLHSFDS